MNVLLHSLPSTLQQATTNPCLHWRFWTQLGRSQSVSCGVTSPFFWVLVCTRFYLCPPQKSISQSWVNSGSSLVGLMATSSRRAYAITKSAAPRAHPCGTPLLTHTFTGDAQTHYGLSLCGVPGYWWAQCLFEHSEYQSA